MSVPSWARAGEKVVCVDDASIVGPLAVKVGATYTIAKVLPSYGWIVGPYAKSKFSVVLSEVSNQFDRNDGAFALGRFRPLITKSQEEDLALFLPLLTGLPVGEEA